MDLDEYQQQSNHTAQYPTLGHAVVYPALGLAGEAGEVVEKIKKVMRNQAGNFSEMDKQNIAAELGDVLWYLAQISQQLGLSLSEIAYQNLTKLQDRQARGVIKGQGDKR